MLDFTRWKNAGSLQQQCRLFIVKYIFNIVCRRLDPPGRKADRRAVVPLLLNYFPSVSKKASPKKFRKMLGQIRGHISGWLVPRVQEELTATACQFLSQNRLKYGAVIAMMTLQNRNSSRLEIRGGHIAFRKWRLREQATLRRTLRRSHQLRELILPGVATDKLCLVIAESCPSLQVLNMSHSYVTDKGVMALCGVLLTDLNPDFSEDTEPKESEESVGLSGLACKMSPLVQYRLQSTKAPAWQFGRRYRATFAPQRFGCRELTRLNLRFTNNPKSQKDLGAVVTRDSILASLLLLPKLQVVEWPALQTAVTYLTSLLQELHAFYGHTVPEVIELNLSSFTDKDNPLKLEDADGLSCPEICPRLSSVHVDLRWTGTRDHVRNVVRNSEVGERQLASIFGIPRLVDLQLSCYSRPLSQAALARTLHTQGNRLTRLSLRLFSSDCFLETLAAVKTACRHLQVFVVMSGKFALGSTAGESCDWAAAHHLDWPSLRQLTIRGNVAIAKASEFLIKGCHHLEQLCIRRTRFSGYSIMDPQRDIMDPQLLRDLLAVNSMLKLRRLILGGMCLGDEDVFFLLNNLPSLEQLGPIAEWEALGEDLVYYLRRNSLSVEFVTNETEHTEEHMY